MSRERRGDALVYGGGAAMGGAAGLGWAEDAYNARVDRKFQVRRDRLKMAYGIDDRGVPVTRSPKLRFHNNPHGVSPQAREKMKADKRRVYGELNQINRESNQARRIPLNGRMGRRWGLAGLGAAASYAGARELTSKADNQRRREVNAFAGGGLLGGVAYQGLSYAQRPYDRRAERQIAHDPRLRAQARAYRKTSNVPKNAKLGHPGWKDYFRDYPRDLPGGRAKRVLSWTHGGKSGAALTTAAVGLAGAGAVHGTRQKVHKGLYRKDERVSVLRAGAAATGLGLAGWGLTRSPMVGRALTHGIKQAQKHNNPYALEALRRATIAAGVVHRGTGVAERHLRQIRAVDAAIQRVPASIRPEVAAGAGILLVSEARPIRRRHYEPVRVRINMNGRQV